MNALIVHKTGGLARAGAMRSARNHSVAADVYRKDHPCGLSANGKRKLREMRNVGIGQRTENIKKADCGSAILPIPETCR
jgi:hypothetical protein